MGDPPPGKASLPETKTVSMAARLCTTFPNSMQSFVAPVACANMGSSSLHSAHRSSEHSNYVPFSSPAYNPVAQEGTDVSRDFSSYLRSEMNMSPFDDTNHLAKIDKIPHPRFALPESTAMEPYAKANEIALVEHIARQGHFVTHGHAPINDHNDYPRFYPAYCPHKAFENSFEDVQHGYELDELERDMHAARKEESSLSDWVSFKAHWLGASDTASPIAIQTMLPLLPSSVSSQTGLVTPITHISPSASLCTNLSQDSWTTPGTGFHSVRTTGSPVMVASNPVTPGSFVSVASEHFSFVEASPDEDSPFPQLPQLFTARRSNVTDTGSPISKTRGRSESPMFPMNTVARAESTEVPKGPPPFRLRVRDESPVAKDLEKSIRQLETDLIVSARAAGMPYKEIMKLSKFKISESTLRGRARNAKLPHKKRPRAPAWTKDDEALLKVAVTRHFAQGAYGTSRHSSRPPWNKVGLWMSENGSSHAFSGSACHKMWDKLNGL